MSQRDQQGGATATQGEEALNTLVQAAKNDFADPRLERLALGTASAEDLAALRQQAQSSAEYKALVELFTPLDEGLRREVTKQSLSALQGQNDEPQTRWIRRLSWAPAPLLALAATWLLFLRPATPPPGTVAAPLPAYQAEYFGFTTPVRAARPSSTPEVSRAVEGSVLQIFLRPEANVSGDVQVVAWAERDQQMVRFQPEAEISDAGAIRLSVDVDRDLGGVGGPRRVSIAVGRGAWVAPSPRDPPADDRWRWSTFSVRVIPAPTLE